MNRSSTFYVLFIYLIFFCFGFYLKSAHGGGLPAQTNGFPSIRSTEYPKHIESAKSCGEYLTICEKSCISRDGLYRFSCLGKDFNPEDSRYRCQCGDEVLNDQTCKVKL